MNGPNGVPPGAIPLQRQTTVQVTDIRLVVPGSLRFRPGGCDQPGCVATLEVVDIANGRVFLVPSNLQGLYQLVDQLERLIAGLDPPATMRKA